MSAMMRQTPDRGLVPAVRRPPSSMTGKTTKGAQPQTQQARRCGCLLKVPSAFVSRSTQQPAEQQEKMNRISAKKKKRSRPGST
mmetsp:Transcript_109042/g.273226  ORF Transcript_109042/g.273226 Transcript_109042/m.273226 type:complete len:84 (+) Transcript_109042:1316-1567(+)